VWKLDWINLVQAVLNKTMNRRTAHQGGNFLAYWETGTEEGICCSGIVVMNAFIVLFFAAVIRVLTDLVSFEGCAYTRVRTQSRIHLCVLAGWLPVHKWTVEATWQIIKTLLIHYWKQVSILFNNLSKAVTSGRTPWSNSGRETVRRTDRQNVFY
jgi:hypothetical protein